MNSLYLVIYSKQSKIIKGETVVKTFDLEFDMKKMAYILINYLKTLQLEIYFSHE